MSKLQEPIVSCGSPFCQIAAVAALTGDQRPVGEMVQEYQRRRDAALKILDERGYRAKYKPSGAFYLPLDISMSGLTSVDFALKLLHDKGVAVAPGSAFDTGFVANVPTTTDRSSPSSSPLPLKRQQEIEVLNQFVRVSLANSLENVSMGIQLICDLLDTYK
jgi:aspartate/methionine/tyrosine aminotransferase